MGKGKTLIFEGAGWDSADNNGVGNCRIRTTFVNNKGVEIYLEMTGHESSRYSTSKDKMFDFPWHITHVFKSEDGDSHYTKEYKSFDTMTSEYTKENILNFVNTKLGCNFENISAQRVAVCCPKC